MKSKDEIFEYLKDMLVKNFECDEEKVTKEARLYEDLDLDSIDAVDMVVSLQKKTGIKVTPDQFKEVKTTNDIVEVVYALLNNNG